MNGEFCAILCPGSTPGLFLEGRIEEGGKQKAVVLFVFSWEAHRHREQFRGLFLRLQERDGRPRAYIRAKFGGVQGV